MHEPLVTLRHPEKPGSMTCPIGAFERLWSKRGWVIASETPAPARPKRRFPWRRLEHITLAALVVERALQLI